MLLPLCLKILRWWPANNTLSISLWVAVWVVSRPIGNTQIVTAAITFRGGWNVKTLLSNPCTFSRPKNHLVKLLLHNISWFSYIVIVLYSRSFMRYLFTYKLHSGTLQLENSIKILQGRRKKFMQNQLNKYSHNFVVEFFYLISFHKNIFTTEFCVY